MDSNMVFAKHWDRMNPSNFVKACNDSRRLQEEEQERLKKQRALYEADRVARLVTKTETKELNVCPD